MKKLLALVLALVMTLSLATVSTNAAFEDAKDISDDYSEAVAVLSGMNIFKGYDEGKTFKPQGEITRAEVATILYRIATADVAKNDKSGLYASYNKFNDMAGASWAAGYIGYCANAELVKGYPDGTFKPSGKVTGYEVLAMILRAVGYDKNNEFSGADWSLNVAKYAEQLGLLKNVSKGTDLGAAASRELVAELLFRGIQANTVTYTPAFGYVTDKVTNKAATTLGTKFELACDETTQDIWGRPTVTWTYNVGDEETVLEVEALASYTEATKNCDIYDDCGLKKGTELDVYTNGVKAAKDYTVADNTAAYGAQGRQVEVYADRIVVIDTYLAYVDDVVTEKTDSKGHTTRDDYMKLEVYNNVNGSASSICVPGNDYEEGDYLLVNVNEVAANKVSIVGVSGKQEYVDILGEAESFVGAQSKIWSNTAKHTVDDTDYDDACRFYLDQAQNTKNAKFTWLLDQFGNLIGAVEVAATTNYAVLKDMIWNVGRPGSAEATIVFMDGSEETVTVNKIYSFGQTEGELCTPELADSNGEVGFDDNKAKVSSDSKYNGAYEGVALYKVVYNNDNTVELIGDDVYHSEHITVDNGSSVINALNVSVNDKTEFLARETDDNGDFVYVSYNRDTLPQYAVTSCNIFYTYNASGFATRVYIKNAANEADFGDHVFAQTDAYYQVVGSYDYKMTVLVDGVEREIATSEDVVLMLAANTEKLFEVEWDYDYDGDCYGFVTEVRLVNEANDDDEVNYVTNGDYAENTIVTDTVSYRVTADTKVIGADSVADIDFAEDGVWVVEADSNTRYAVAGTVYVGTKLSANTALEVYAHGGNVAKHTPADASDYVDFDFTSNLDAESAKLSFVVAADNAVIVSVRVDDEDATGFSAGQKETFIDVQDSDELVAVVVMSEDGANHEVYVISLTWTESEVYNWVELGANPSAAVSDSNPAVGYYEMDKLLVKVNDDIKISDFIGVTLTVTRNVTNAEGVVTTETWTDNTAVINTLLNAGWTVKVTNSSYEFTVVK